ncbi:MAG: 2-isopropylmalate synthase [Candidatus Accumulibacter regalis]|mgnify:FL=1|jgi:2-isopropylmalate synthase|uniref:2-isopropylmalate synthase n=1 Tax=Accumulibacter regalis TaxID=522306 RepID=A0A011QCJ2_ACCRE|nr:MULTISPECIES: 2-isopropylmalate synthase [unclassified Candidatus Accumulibacter]EXI86977.1 MAG: 2-isopropylmalate synthase [Candidatus Accumulibacter regalis]MQM33384.1 2-isopropylmalate synthase [Candidatus Accumulibacter phosphatis]MBL8366405.1 2-isopropylmalate synthase [Accumulibacter sp.]MBN8516253.1 2-isopropylmalate synthase [Accumulibacter sp.]HRE70438.1 2-isopropylmalate synthase [Accumulibacter sp.]
MLSNPASKYRSFPPVALADRQWPNATISKPPIWMSTDLRDGNQSLFEPMNAERKTRMFRMLCEIGFKEIEVAFPSASQTDFDFVRSLIEGDHIPDDVSIEVLTQAREHLIRRTMASVRGARRAIVHVYNATSKPFRETVFQMSREEVIDMAVVAVKLIRDLAAQAPETEWVLEYSPETFTATELDFALEVCNAVTAAWGATRDNKVILNLPTTVEMATPNIYADQIEWMHRHLDRRDSVIISLHPHNDRGTAVAAAELALMAGAERVEGCLFGNGERTGNVDLVTLALNLYTQGVAPGLDFSDINAVARTFEQCSQLPIHPRHPYVGDLVFTAFSGSHQDAIKKGFAVGQSDGFWNVPYLPIDPADLGRSYDSVIRVNSQSGKGGIAYLLESEYGVVMPRRLQVEFSGVVQQHVDAHGGEMSAAAIWQLFSATYIDCVDPVRYREHHLFEHGGGNGQGIRLNVDIDGTSQVLTGTGNGPIDAAVNAFQSVGIHIQVRSYEERAMSPSGEGGNARACAFIEVAPAAGGGGEFYGAGVDTNIVTASLRALITGINRLEPSVPRGAQQQAA